MPVTISQNILRSGAAAFGAGDAPLRSLGGMDGAVYTYARAGQGYVIKFVPVTEEKVPVLREKWDFVSYLAEHGVRVSRPVPSQSGRLVELLEGDDQLYAVFQSERARGEHVDRRKPGAFDAALFRAWGRVMGRMHALTQGYTGGEHIQGWREEQAFMANWCPDPAVREKWAEMAAYLESLPQPPEAYGLIHNDLHPWNFLVHEGEITVIDFDVCNHHWFATDIGIAGFHALWMGVSPDEEGDQRDFARHFFRHFLAGYAEENALDAFWLRRLPRFMAYRRLLLFSVFSNEWPEPRQPWQAQTLARWRRGILSDTPVVAWSWEDDRG